MRDSPHEMANVQFKLGPRRNNSVVSALLSAVICLCLAGVGLYIAVAGKELKGGIPFLPRALNQGVGRVLVGGAGVFTGALGLYAVFEAVTLLKAKAALREKSRLSEEAPTGKKSP